jgi:hypothetical protein
VGAQTRALTAQLDADEGAGLGAALRPSAWPCRWPPSDYTLGPERAPASPGRGAQRRGLPVLLHADPALVARRPSSA